MSHVGLGGRAGSPAATLTPISLPRRLRQPKRPGDPRSQRRVLELQGRRFCRHWRRLRHLHPHHHLPRRPPDQDPQAAPEAHAAAGRSLVPQHLGQPQMQRERRLRAQRHHHPLTDYREQLLPALREGERGLRAPRLHRAGDAPSEPSQHLLQGVRSSLGTPRRSARWGRRREAAWCPAAARRGSAGVWRLAAPCSPVRCLSLFVFSFVVLSFCNPKTLRVSRQHPPLLLGLWLQRALCLPVPACAPLAPADSHLPFCTLGFALVASTPSARAGGLGAATDAERSSEEPWEEEDASPRCRDAENCAGRKLANPIYYYYYYYYYNYFNFFVTFLFL